LTLLHNMKTKHCANCGKILIRRQGETATNFKRRKCCSPECAFAYRKKKTEEKYLSQYTERKCINCGKKLTLKKGEPLHEFIKRQFCNRKCVYTWRKKQLQKKVKQLNKKCLWCNKPLKLRKKESITSFEKRKFCNQDCFHKYRSARNPQYKKKKSKNNAKAKIERCLSICFDEAKVWVNGKLVMDDGWKDEEWWENKIKKTNKELREGKALSRW